MEIFKNVFAKNIPRKWWISSKVEAWNFIKKLSIK